MRELGRCCCFVPLGLGKTIITLTALRDLGVLRTLVLAPAKVVETGVWSKEAARWAHAAHLTVCNIWGPAEKREQILALKSNIDVLSYENVMWLTEKRNLRDHYDAIVFDELSKVKDPGTSRYKRLRAEVEGIDVRFGLTATPVGNALIDIWGEVFIVCGPAPLGPRFTDFRAKWFIPIPIRPNVSMWRPCAIAEEEIHKAIKPWSFSLDAKLAPQKLPEFRINEIEVQLPKEVRALEEKLAAEAVAELSSGTELKVLSASAMAQKVRQLASGAVYTDPLDETKWEEVHDAKLTAVKELVEQLQGEPLMVFYWFRHELERLRKAIPGALHADDPGALDEWNERKVPVLLAHPMSVGYGLNLQEGGFNVCWFTLPWQLEAWLQSNGRLARTGQPSPYVVAHILLGGECDHAVLEVLRRKGRTQDNLLKAVEI